MTIERDGLGEVIKKIFNSVLSANFAHISAKFAVFSYSGFREPLPYYKSLYFKFLDGFNIGNLGKKSTCFRYFVEKYLLCILIIQIQSQANGRHEYPNFRKKSLHTPFDFQFLGNDFLLYLYLINCFLIVLAKVCIGLFTNATIPGKNATYTYRLSVFCKKKKSV